MKLFSSESVPFLAFLFEGVTAYQERLANCNAPLNEKRSQFLAIILNIPRPVYQITTVSMGT